MPAPPGEQYRSAAQEGDVLRLGTWVFLGSELLLFAALFALYAAFRTRHPAEFVQAIRHNTLASGTLNMYLLLTSSLFAALAVSAMRAGRPRRTLACLGATFALGLAFLAVKSLEYLHHVREGALPGSFYRLASLPGPGANRFYLAYWLMTGFHTLHVVAGVTVIAWLALRTLAGHYTPERHAGLEMGTLYWHLVDVIWILLWPLLYLA